MDPNPSELSGFTNIQDVNDWIGFTDDGDRKTWSSFASALGKPKMIRHVAAAPYTAYMKVVAGWKVPDKVAGATAETEPTAIELGHAGLLRRISRIMLHLDPDEEKVPGAVPSATMAAIPAMIQGAVNAALPAASGSNKIMANKVIDQGDDTEVAPMDQKEIDKLLEEWKIRENDGEEPTEGEEATSAQLSALYSRTKNGGPCFVDMGIWRPFGNRMGRALRFTIHTMRPNGTMQPKEVSGPSDFQAWSKSWKVFAFAMSTLKLASRTRLARYHERITELTEEYPKYWWIICLADIRMRSEYIERKRRQCVKQHADGELPDFDPLRPWDVVFREAASDDKYWAREVDKKVILHLTNLASESQLTDEGYGVLEEAEDPVKQKQKGKKSHGKKRKASSSSEDEGQGRKHKPRKGAKGAKGAGKKGDAKKGAAKGGGKNGTIQYSNGKFAKFNGLQVCYSWNRQLNGCTEPCPDGRAHVCELCTGVHRGVQCETPKQR